MFLQIAVAAIGIGIVVMIGYLIVANVQTSLQAGYTLTNPCYNNLLNSSVCLNNTAPCYASAASNTSATCVEGLVSAGVSGVRATSFSGFALVAVGIIVLAAFGLISVFR